MINITLPDGTVKQFEKGSTAMDVAMSISEGLARNVLSASINGEVCDATLPINEDANLVLHTFRDKEGKSTFWHSTAHLMAEALEALYPGVKLGVGPSINNGFYYDVDFGDRTEKRKKSITEIVKDIADADNPDMYKDLPELQARASFVSNASESNFMYKLI